MRPDTIPAPRARPTVLAEPQAAALGASEQRFNWRLNYMGASKWFFSASGVIMLIGALAIAGNGLNFGIDFESGSETGGPTWSSDLGLDDADPVAFVMENVPELLRDKTSRYARVAEGRVRFRDAIPQFAGHAQ